MLKENFRDILEKYGYPVLLVRSESKIQCSCWNEIYMSANRDCPVCFGQGTVPVVEKHTVRSITMTIPQTLANAVGVASLGPVAFSSQAFYFLPTAKIKSGDLIVEVEWTETGKPIYTNGNICEVAYVQPNRFEGGENIFHKVFVSNKSIESGIRGVRIANVSGIKNYEIIKEKGE